MSKFDQDIMSEIIKINSATVRSKISKRIAEETLIPILNTIRKRTNEVATLIGEDLVFQLCANIMMNQSSGGEYTVVQVSGPKGNAEYEVIGTYNPSASHNPPKSVASGNDLLPTTGTLLSSIEYKIEENGSVRVGIFNSPGTEFRSLFFKGGKIFVSEEEGDATNVIEYAQYLETGTEKMMPRPWFTSVLNDEFRAKIRKTVKEKMRKIVKEETRSKTIAASMYFRVYFEKEYDTEMFFDD